MSHTSGMTHSPTMSHTPDMPSKNTSIHNPGILHNNTSTHHPNPTLTGSSSSLGGASMLHGNGNHQMSPFLFTRTEDFFVLFRGADIQSTAAFVGALLISFVFSILTTFFSQILRLHEAQALSSTASNILFKIAGGGMHAFRQFLHYVAMLIVMTMNVWLILAVVFGHAIGWILYAIILHRKLAANKPAFTSCDC